MRNRIVNFLLAVVLVIAVMSCQQSGTTENVSLDTTADSVGYAIGVMVGENNRMQIESVPGGDEINVDAMVAAFRAASLSEETEISSDQANAIIQAYFQQAGDAEAQSNLEEGNAFLEENQQREGVNVTESGLQYEILEEGTGESPDADDRVRVHYHGTLIDGTVFDSSVERGEPATFGVNQVIPGWTEALQMMKEGGKWKIYLPSLIAYGQQSPSPDIGPNSTLIFEVELLEIVE